MHVKYLARGLTNNKHSINISYYPFWDHGPGIHPGALRYIELYFQNLEPTSPNHTPGLAFGVMSQHGVLTMKKLAVRSRGYKKDLVLSPLYF